MSIRRPFHRSLPAQLLSTAIAALLCACGTGSSPAEPATENKTQPLLPAAGAAEGLPDLSILPAPRKQLAFTGPGYHSFAGAEYISAGGVVDAGSKAELLGSAPCSYAIYSLGGFAGDMRPTSIRFSGEDFAAEYWLAYADYRSGRWRFAGPYDSNRELPLPATASPGGLADFLSPEGNCSVAVLTAQSQSVTVNSLELGVDGGIAAPAPPLYISVSGGAEGILIHWLVLHEPEADLAGYRVERSPALKDNFAALNSELIEGDFYLDATAAEGLSYQYRVAAVDTSGNASFSDIAVGSRSGVSIGPVPVLSMDPGPYEAPATVRFDLSGSYVIGPGSIDTYSVQIMMGPGASGGSPQMDLILEPGCYLAIAEVSMGAVSRGVYVKFKVYPKWQSTDRLVIPGDVGATHPKLYMVQTARLPQSEDLCVFGVDPALDSLVVYRQDGTEFDMRMQYSFGPILSVNEPVRIGAKLALPVAHSSSLFTLVFDGTRLGIMESFSNFGINTAYSLASDGAEKLYSIYPSNDGVETDLVISEALLGGPVVIINDTGPLQDLDCVWNPGAAAIDIVYAQVTSMQWLRWDPVNHVVLDSATLDTFINPVRLDLELDSDDGSLQLAYWLTDDWHYRSYDGAWSFIQDVDPAIAAQSTFDLLSSEGEQFIYGLHDGGSATLYRHSTAGGNWPAVVSPPLAAGATTLSICPSDTAGAVYAASAASLHGLLHEMGPGDSAHLLLDIPPVAGLGRCLKAAAGSDGLFVGGLDASGHVYLSRSIDRGTSWTPYGAVPSFATALDLGTQHDGEVYVSYDNPDLSGDYQLYKWNDGTNALDDLSIPQPGLPQHRPFLSNSPSEDSISWACYDDTLGNLNVLYGDSGVLGTGSIQPAANPFWLGSLPGSENRVAFSLLDGANVWEGRFASVHLASGEIGGIVDPGLLIAPPATIGTHPLVLSHLLDSTKFLSLQEFNPIMPFDERYACVMAYGSWLDALRYVCSHDGLNSSSTDLPMGIEGFGLFSGELRRTVAAAEGLGLTGVTFLSNLDGSHARLQWSNYGDWEDLPLPSGVERMSGAELLIGEDGRWYLIWHDLRSDAIYSRATQ